MTWEKYFEDDTKANEWFDRMMDSMAYKMFESQDLWIHMAGELGEGRKPMIKSYTEFEYAFSAVWNDVMGWLKSFAKHELLRMYAESDIDFPYLVAEDYNDWMGLEPGDDGYVEGRYAYGD